jgi:phosphoglycolate phosphatase
MYRHVLWDWNGTLLDDAWLSVEIINQLLARRGKTPISAARYGQVFGFPLPDYCRRLGFDLERDPFAALSDEFAALYERRRLECRLQAGALETLVALHRRGVEQSLLSAYRQETLAELVAHFGLGGWFTAVVGVDNPYGEGKIELGRRRRTALPYPGREIVLVGDTLHDLEVARVMDVDCVLMPSGHQHRDRLKESGARVVANLTALPDLLAPEQPRGGG